MENTIDFSGGIRLTGIPDSEKADISIIRAQPPFVALPAEDSVSVRVGDRVLVGTAVGISRSMTVYSSVSGIVTKTSDRRVVIENDGSDKTAEPFEKPGDSGIYAQNLPCGNGRCRLSHSSKIRKLQRGEISAHKRLRM